MKEKLISRLVVAALAGVAAMGAQAGQIQSSSTAIAREVITNDTQTINSPTVSYRFAGDVDARVQTQTFQVQLKLLAGKWASAGNASSIALTDGVDATPWTQNAVPAAQTYQVVGQGLSADKTTLFVTIQVDTVGGKSLLKQPLVTFSAAATKPTIDNLFSVVQAITKCDTSVKNAQVEVHHFVGLSSPAAIAVNGTNGVEDESVRPGSTNTGTLLTFPTNIKVDWTAADGNAKVDVSASQTKFAGSVTGTISSFIDTTHANLGKVVLTQNAQGYDSNLTNQYLLTGNPANSGITEAATATLNDGNVEAKSFDVVVTPSNGFAVGSTLGLSTAANCSAIVAGTTTAAFTATTAVQPATLSVTSAVNQLAFGNSGTGPLYVCYTVDGTNPIPSSAFSVLGTLTKSAAGANLNEQNNFCDGPLYALGGSVKIDVRNYANSKDPGGWMSVIRLINPDEVRTVDVYGQIIQADGKYGPWGKIATLAPRAVQNLTAAQVDVQLTNAPAHATTSYNGASMVEASSTGVRLRITSPNAQTLRVQNYLYNPASQNFIEASSSQAVDFSGSTDRAPINEGQYQSQDAWKGLNGGN